MSAHRPLEFFIFAYDYVNKKVGTHCLRTYLLGDLSGLGITLLESRLVPLLLELQQLFSHGYDEIS